MQYLEYGNKIEYTPPSSPAAPTISDLEFDAASRTLTCTSTGSPATTVTWTKDGDTLTVDGTTYSMTQNVTDRSASTYENVFTLPATGDISGTYSCQVGNALGNSSTMTFEVTGKYQSLWASSVYYCGKVPVHVARVQVVHYMFTSLCRRSVQLLYNWK